MQFSVETLNGLDRRIEITVPAENVKVAVKEELKRVAKTARIDGFRKGKIPPQILEQRFGVQVHQDVVSELMQKEFFNAVMKDKINLASRPSFTLEAYTPGQDLKYSATFQVYPEVTLQGLDKIEVEKPVVEIKEADIDNMINILRKQQASWLESQDVAKTEDRITLDFNGSIDGEAFEGGKAENFVLLMGQGRMIPGFEEGIVGHKAGESFDIEVTFPEDYHAENLKGKKAIFAIHLKKIEIMELPEVNDSFVAKFVPGAKTVSDLRKEIEKNMQRELKNVVASKIKTQVIDGLLAQNEIEVPTDAIEQEIEVLRHQSSQRFGGDPKAAAQLPRELFEQQAKRRVQVGLLFSEVIKSNDIKINDERVKAMIEEVASAYEQPKEVIEYYNKNAELMQNMRNIVLEEQAVDAVLAQVKVSEKQASFDEIMNPQQA